MPIDRAQMQDVSKMMFDMMGQAMRATPLIPWLYAHDPECAKWRARTRTPIPR